MRSIYAVIIGAILLIPLTGRVVAETDVEKAAVERAKAWLGLVDRGLYGESWEASASAFKKLVGEVAWETQLTLVRKPLGPVLSRTVKAVKHVTELPGSPEGEYVLILFETSFENKPSARERVTPMLDEDGIWRVSGYYIK